MAMLECPGVFTLPFVADGWTATLEGNLYELQPPTRDAALHISVYQRQPTPMEPGQAEALLRQFVDRHPTEGSVDIRALSQDGDEQRAFAKYQNRAEGGALSAWFVGCILWPTAMLMCSCIAPPGNLALEQGEIMIASIFQGTEPG